MTESVLDKFDPYAMVNPKTLEDVVAVQREQIDNLIDITDSLVEKVDASYDVFKDLLRFANIAIFGGYRPRLTRSTRELFSIEMERIGEDRGFIVESNNIYDAMTAAIEFMGHSK